MKKLRYIESWTFAYQRSPNGRSVFTISAEIFAPLQKLSN